MKITLLTLFMALIFASCSKEKNDTVTVSYIVKSGNPDGVLMVRKPTESTYVSVANGSEIEYKTTYSRDGSNLIMMWYRTNSPAGPEFNMSINYDGKSFPEYYLSEQFSKYHYEIDLPHKL